MSDRSFEQLTAAIREIQARVEQRHPTTAKGSIGLANLMPVVHARDAAHARVASIGGVNPRPPGLVNNAIQSVKRLIARSLGWFVRDQVEFNRAAVQCIEALLEAHSESNRAMAELADRIETLKVAEVEPLKHEAREASDIRAHWHQWRQDWERKLAINEAQFMRSLADLQLAYQQKAALADGQFREHVANQHRDYLAALDRATADIQKRLWTDFERMRAEMRAGFEAQIHHELRVVRQRQALPVATAATVPKVVMPEIDWLQFATKFRGKEEDIQARFARYAPLFEGRETVLDLGCGRGEFLALAPQAHGIDMSAENVALCVAKGRKATTADMFAYLDQLSPASVDGIFCAQVIEHLPAGRLPELVRLCAKVSKPGAVIVFETPNPECLAIFATHFYLDPTHVRPVPPALMHFYLEEAGFGSIEVTRLGTAANDYPELAALPEPLRQRFFGAMDYAISARRL